LKIVYTFIITQVWKGALSFCVANGAGARSHVVLEPQHDIALLQCDVSAPFGSFFAQKPSSSPPPRRVGAPTRHGTLPTDGQHLEDLLYLTRGNQLYTEDGEELYIDPTSQKRTFHTQYEPDFIVAREKSPLELLIENKELFDK